MKLVVFQQNENSDMTDRGRRRPLNIQTPSPLQVENHEQIINYLQKVDDPFGIHDMTDRRSNPMHRNTQSRHKRFVSSLIS